jgi:hypothetical protein
VEFILKVRFPSSHNNFKRTYYSHWRIKLCDVTASINHTCVPKVGVFLLHLERLNFFQALNSCRTEDSELAHVISETRTTALSALVKQMRVSRGPKRAYVGLDDMKVESRFTTTMGNWLYLLLFTCLCFYKARPLNCVMFVALAHMIYFQFIIILK